MNEKALKWLSENIHANLENKTIVITGANAGIGFEVAKYCAYYKMNVVMAVRNLERGQKAKDEILKEFPEAKLDLQILDVSKEDSIKSFVNYITKSNIYIDVFYHNAGVYHMPYEVLENGLELTLMTNYYGPLMLESLLRDYYKSLKHEVRVIFTGSVAAKRVKLKEESLTPDEKTGSWYRYCCSKRLDSYLMHYLALKNDENIKYFLVHPGGSATSLFNKAFKSKVFVKIVNWFMKTFSNPPWKSALSTIRLFEDDVQSGDFYGPANFFDLVGYPKKRNFVKYNDEKGKQLIEKSMEICGYYIK